MTTFRVLGSIEVRAPDGSHLGPSGGRQRALLAMLLAADGGVVPVDRLTEAMWPIDRPRNELAALHNQVSRLRDLLRRAGMDGDTLASRQPGYLLDVPADAVDAARFEALCAEAGTQPAPIAARTWEEALSLPLLRTHPEVSTAAIASLSDHLTQARAALGRLATDSVEQRVAATVLALAERAGHDRADMTLVQIPLVHADLAAMCRTTTGSVSRTLSRWRRRG